MATINATQLPRIGDGPVATVYSGHHAGAVVALKVFPKRLDKKTLAAFTKEQARLSTVRRVTSILPVDGVDELSTGEFTVRMERCTQSLADLVERTGQLSPADVVVLGRAAALALAAAHGAGVVHGGISPNNILFRATGEPVVADFGITLRQAFARDPLYAIEFLPPETLRTGALNEATDLYGLGAVLHYALSGRSPHPGRLGEQPGERVLRILGEPVPAINTPGVPVQLSTLVARLLAADPAHRQTSATATATQLAAMLPDPPAAQPRHDFDDFSASHHLPRARRQPRPISTEPDDFDDFATPHYRPAPGRPVMPVATPRPTTPPAMPHQAPAPIPAPAVLPTTQPQPAPPAAPNVSTAPPGVSEVAAVSAVPPPEDAPVPPAPGSVTMPAAPVSAPPAAQPEVAPVVASPATSVPESPIVDEGADVHGESGAAARAARLRALRRERVRSVSVGRVAEEPDAVGDSPAEATEVGLLPLASLAPAPIDPVPIDPVPIDPVPIDPVPTDVLPPAATVEFRVQGRERLDFDDDFADLVNPARGQVQVLASPLAPPGHAPRKLVRYDLLAGAALLLALLALVPLLLFRGDPEEISSTPQVPAENASAGGDVEIRLAEPVDMTDEVRLSWSAPDELDFMVVVAAEGKKTEYELAERNHSMTLRVELDLKYCFQVQATDGDDTYESNIVAIRDATCRN